MEYHAFGIISYVVGLFTAFVEAHEVLQGRSAIERALSHLRRPRRLYQGFSYRSSDTYLDTTIEGQHPNGSFSLAEHSSDSVYVT